MGFLTEANEANEAGEAGDVARWFAILKQGRDGTKSIELPMPDWERLTTKYSKYTKGERRWIPPAIPQLSRISRGSWYALRILLRLLRFLAAKFRLR
jgi:hypothetical protein